MKIKPIIEDIYQHLNPSIKTRKNTRSLITKLHTLDVQEAIKCLI